MIEDNLYLSQKNCTGLVSLPEYLEEIDYRGIGLVAGRLQMDSPPPVKNWKRS
jgi:hypothetical protein